MAHFDYIRPGAVWAALSVLTSNEEHLFDVHQFKSINGDDGGTWAPAAPIVIGGSGLHVTGPLTADDADITITTGRYLTVNSGGHILGAAGSVVVWSGTNTFSHATTLVTFGTWTFDADAALALNGATTMSATGTLVTAVGSGINIGGGLTVLSGGQATVASGGILHLNSGGAITVASGGTVTAAVGSTVALNGAVTMASGATLTCAAGSTVTVNGACVFGAGASLTAATTAPWTLNNVTTCAGSIILDGAAAHLTIKSTGATLTTEFGAVVVRGANETRTGSETLSGNGAYQNKRFIAGSAADHTYDGRQYDKISVPALAGNIAYTFSDLGVDDRVMLLVERYRIISGNTLQLKRGDGSVMATFGSAFGAAAWIDWNGTTWDLSLPGGAVT